MSRRQLLVERILKSFSKGEHIVRIPSSDLGKDQKLMGRMFYRRGEHVRISKDEDNGFLWFKKKD